MQIHFRHAGYRARAGDERHATVGVLSFPRSLLERHGVRLCALGTPEYPASLAQIPDAPHLLYVRGTIQPADANAVAAGVTTIEHCSFVTETNERRFDEQLAAMIAEQGIFVCPTINVNAPHVAELTGIVVGEHLAAMRDLGVRIIAGTDTGIDNTPHHQYAGGLEYLVKLGFRAADVITMATTEAAAALGLGAVTGRLAPGYEADLIVVHGDPLTDIAALGRLRRVIARGRDYMPDSGCFDVSAPGTPFADSPPSLR